MNAEETINYIKRLIKVTEKNEAQEMQVDIEISVEMAKTLINEIEELNKYKDFYNNLIEGKIKID